MANMMLSEPDDTTAIIAGSAKKALQAVEQRCTEALKALEQDDHLVALGAVVGLDEQLRQITARLLVLREIAEYKNKK